MISPSKASKRLGIVGAAAVVGLVPVSFLATPAFASSVSSPTLAVSPATVGAPAATATNGFTATTAVPAAGSITINSLSTAGAASAANSEQLPTTAANYSVSVTPSGGTAANDPVTVAAGATANSVTLNVANLIPAGAAVTVTITGVANPTSPSTVYFNDATSTDTTALNTNTVSIGNAVVTTPSITQVNPNAYGVASQQFTIVGTNFVPGTGATGTNPNAPVVCFVQSGTAAPAPGATTATTCPATATSAPATVTFASAGEIQGTSPTTLVAGKTYNVVVYNYNASATGGATFIAASPTSSNTLVGVASQNAGLLNFVPESGVRVADSRSGQVLPRGTLPTGSPVAVPITVFNNTPTNPTNVTVTSPAAAMGMVLNVTAVAPTGPGNLQLWAGTSCATNPGTATVNFQAPQDTNNSTVLNIPAGATTLCVQDNGSAVNAVIDVLGYATTYTGTQTRLLDTRPATQTGGLQGPLQSGTVYRFATGLGAGSTVALNVAAVAPSGAGNLRVFPEPASGAPAASQVPNTAVDTYIPGTDSSAMLITQVGANGYLDIYSDMGGATGTVNVVIDELGVPGNSVHTIATPYRIADTRPGPLAAGSTTTIAAAPTGSGSNFVPGNALGVIGNLADINPAGPGYMVTFPAGGTLPGTANIAHFPMQTRSTNAPTALNPSNGSMSLYNAGATSNATYDVTGWIG